PARVPRSSALSTAQLAPAPPSPHTTPTRRSSERATTTKTWHSSGSLSVRKTKGDRAAFSRSTKTPRSSRFRGSWCLAWWAVQGADRKSTRLNGSHVEGGYAVFCWKIEKHQQPMRE